MVGDKVEMGKNLLLLLEILVYSFFAEFDFRKEGVKTILYSLVGTGDYKTWI